MEGLSFLEERTGILLSVFLSLSLCFPLYAEGTSLTSSLRYQEVASSVSYFLNQLVVDGLVMMMSVIFLAETTTSPTLYTLWVLSTGD